MLSHTRNTNICAIDTAENWVVGDDLAGEDPTQIPWDFDQLERDQLREEQRIMEEYQMAIDSQSGYELKDGLLSGRCTLHGSHQAVYPFQDSSYHQVRDSR